MLEASTIDFLTILLMIVSVIYFLIKNDELPALIVAFFYACGVMRYNAVVGGLTNWVRVVYAVEIFHMNDELGLVALNYFFLGTVLFSVGYMLFSYKEKKVDFVDSPEIFNNFLQTKQKFIIGLYIVFLLINSVTSGVMSGHSGGYAMGMSYFYLFKMALGGLILLFFLLFKNLPKEKIFQKIVFGVLMLGAVGASWNTTQRFQFLSWAVAIMYIIIGSRNTIFKSILYGGGGIVLILVFTILGNMRYIKYGEDSFEQQIADAKLRLQVSEDANMLDGFMMVLQVYPDQLDYTYGMEHFEILLRPIPRAIWPDKPVGGYANKLHLNDNMGGYTVGISQSIYGSFYGEGGVMGIVILCIVYALMFYRLFLSTKKYNSDMRLLLHGIILTSAIPILRGGDLPGIVAFIGMSYWPVFLFLFLYKRHLKKITLQP